MKKTIVIATLTGLFSLVAHANTDIHNAAQAEAFLNTQLAISPTSGSVDVSGVWGDKTNNSFTLTATLNVDALADYIGKDATATTITPFLSVTTDSTTIGAAIGQTKGADDVISFNGVIGAYHNGTEWLTTYKFEEWATTPKPHELGAVDLSDVTAAALSLSHVDTSRTIVYLTLVRESGATTYYGYDSGLKMSGGLGDLKSISYDTSLVTSLSLMPDSCGQNVGFLNEAAIKAIPEPATATLSLLALAGLAARRRRK